MSFATAEDEPYEGFSAGGQGLVSGAGSAG